MARELPRAVAIVLPLVGSFIFSFIIYKLVGYKYKDKRVGYDTARFINGIVILVLLITLFPAALTSAFIDEDKAIPYSARADMVTIVASLIVSAYIFEGIMIPKRRNAAYLFYKFQKDLFIWFFVFLQWLSRSKANPILIPVRVASLIIDSKTAEVISSLRWIFALAGYKVWPGRLSWLTWAYLKVWSQFRFMSKRGFTIWSTWVIICDILTIRFA